MLSKNGVKILILIFIFSSFFVGNNTLAASKKDKDTDKDGLSDKLEAYYHTDKNNPDTDGDGYNDGIEVEYDYSPHAGPGVWMNEFDYDKDGLNDWLERWFGSDIGVADTDKDKMSDFDEVMFGRDPLDKKSDEKKFDRRIEVDRSSQRLNYYVDKVKLLNLPVSTGNPSSQTPEGTFSIERMIPDKRYVGPGYDLAGVKWNMQFKPSYYLHGAYWHNDFGIRTHSHGCVNLRTEDAGLLYKYMDIGVPVEVIGETPSGYYVGT